MIQRVIKVTFLLISLWTCLTLHSPEAPPAQLSPQRKPQQQQHHAHHSKDYRLPIVFTFTVVKSSCKDGFPSYIRAALQQSIYTQPDCLTILLSNIGDCPSMINGVSAIRGLELIDSTLFTSNRTKTFETSSKDLFYDNINSLWMTSALRFFLLEDLMIHKKWKELIHFEIDNMLYGRLTTILPGLRKHYRLAATPLNFYVTFITASVFWVGNVDSLHQFNNFLFDIALNRNKTHDKYIEFLRPTSSKEGGLYPDKSGLGVKPFAINEMSMLSYYHALQPEELKLFPVIPEYNFPVFPDMPYIPNITCFTPRGEKVGPKISTAIWDSGSYGQYIGGTKDKQGKNKRFTDGSHIAGIAIRISRCEMVFYCHNITEMDYGLPRHRKHHHKQNITHSHHVGIGRAETNQQDRGLMIIDYRPSRGRCYTAPFVRCENDRTWIPLWNLHVHSKLTHDFLSEPCDCRKAGGNSSVSIYVNVEEYHWKPSKSPIA